jgi:hypothetical protein
LPLIITLCQWFFIWEVYSISRSKITPISDSLFAAEEVQVDVYHNIDDAEHLRQTIIVLKKELTDIQISDDDTASHYIVKVEQNIRDMKNTIDSYINTQQIGMPSMYFDPVKTKSIYTNELSLKVQTIKSNLDQLIIIMLDRQNTALGLSALLSLGVMILFAFTGISIIFPLGNENIIDIKEVKSDVDTMKLLDGIK